MVSLELLRTKFNEEEWDVTQWRVQGHFYECASNPDKTSDGCRMWAQYLREFKQVVEGQYFEYRSDTGGLRQVTQGLHDFMYMIEIPTEVGGVATAFAAGEFAEASDRIRQVALMAVLPPLDALRHFGPWFRYGRTQYLNRTKINTEATRVYDVDDQELSPIIYGLTVMLSDGYLKVAHFDSEAARFWRIMRCLPIELQMVMALRAGGKNGVVLPMSPFLWQVIGAMTAISPS